MNEMLDMMSDLIKKAMKEKEKDRLKVLRYLMSLLLENKTSAHPIVEMDVIIKHAKKLKDSLDLYKNDATRMEEIQKEIAIVAEFMPQELSLDEVKKMIKEIISNLETPQMGAVMKELSGKIKGRFDGKQASDLVKEALRG